MSPLKRPPVLSCPGRAVNTHAVLQMSAEAAVKHKHPERRLHAGTPGVFSAAAQVSVEHRLHRQTFKGGRDTKIQWTNRQNPDIPSSFLKRRAAASEVPP